jgi:DNA-binding NarL/FixJ family response regulator
MHFGTQLAISCFGGVSRRSTEVAPMNELTNQERRVLGLVARGYRNAKIARELFVSTRTVETHLYHIFDKLDVSSRTEAALFALRMGLLATTDMEAIARERATVITRDLPYARN